MEDVEAARRFILALEESRTQYMLVGSLSSILYSYPRTTKDVDVVFQAPSGMASRLMQLLGPEFRLDRQMMFETITGTYRQVIEVVDSVFKLELFRLSDDAHDQVRFTRKRKAIVEPLNLEVWVPTPEDVIVTKLRWARNKDREDVAAVIGVQGNAIDWDYVHHWTEQHGTRKLLDEIRATIPQID